MTTEFRDTSGNLYYPYGKEPIGILIFDPDGHMSAQIMDVGRAPFASPDRLLASAEEVWEAFQGYVAYYGTYRIDEQERSVTNHVEGSLVPNMINTDQKRLYEFTPNLLTLRPPPRMFNGVAISGSLTWERVSPVNRTADK